MSSRERETSAARRKVANAQTLYILRTLVIASILAGAVMFHVSNHGNAIRLGYQLSAAQKKNRDLLRDNDELKVRRASLSAANRLETIARNQLGLVQPTSNQVITLRGTPHQAHEKSKGIVQLMEADVRLNSSGIITPSPAEKSTGASVITSAAAKPSFPSSTAGR